MRTVKAVPVTLENFAPFGQIYDMINPSGYALTGDRFAYYPDRMTADSQHRLGFSPLVLKKTERMIVTSQEYHSRTWEIILPLDDDMVINCAPASGGTPVPEETRAFVVPKLTMVKINAAIWHCSPWPVNKETATALFMSPECNYMNDSVEPQFTAEQQFEIVL